MPLPLRPRARRPPGEAANQLMESALVVYVMSEASVASTRCRDMIYLSDNVSKPILPVAIGSFEDIDRVIDAGVQMIVSPLQWTFLKFREEESEKDGDALLNLSRSVSRLLEETEDAVLDEESASFAAELTYRRASTTFGSADDAIDRNMPKRQNEMDAKSKIAHASVFISWAHADRTLATYIWESCRARSISCWIDFDIQPGHGWRSEIARAIKESKLMVFIGTDNSMKSKYCYDELLFAKARGVAVLPIMIKNRHTKTTSTDAQTAKTERLLSEMGVLEVSGALTMPDGRPTKEDGSVCNQLCNQIKSALKAIDDGRKPNGDGRKARGKR